jgi:microcystin-dependent protein
MLINNYIIFIILSLFVLIIIYLIHHYNKIRENFAVSDDIKVAINEVYQADIDAMRNLANISKSIMNSNDLLNIPANEVNMLGATTNVKGNLVVDGTVKFTNKNSNIMEIFPKYMVISWANNTTPKGWALCDGNTYKLDSESNAIVSNEGNVIKTPDLRGRFVLGSGQGTNLINRNLGDSGGSETHKLTVNEMPKHTHGISWSGVGSTGGLSGGNALNYVQGAYMGDWPYSLPQTFPQNTNEMGQSLPHNNMPPFYVLTYIMKL